MSHRMQCMLCGEGFTVSERPTRDIERAMMAFHMPACKGPALEGKKHDGGKQRWDLLPWPEVAEVVKVVTFGAEKYAPDNWKSVPSAKDRYFAAAMRHLVAWRAGEREDRESGVNHLAHAACCILFMLYFEPVTKNEVKP